MASRLLLKGSIPLMKLRLHLLAILFSACLCAQAFAAQSYSAIYVFGDSYCDTGNIYLATLTATPKSPPYYYGRFSNGPLWVEYVAAQFHLPVLPALLGGTNYAIGGAEVLKQNTYPQGTVPSVEEEVAAYLFLHDGKADPNALYVIEGGGLDILNATSGSPLTLGYSVGTGLLALEAALHQAGAQHFFIPNLLDVGRVPEGAARASFNTAATVSVNQLLADSIPILRLTQFGTDIYTADIYTAANEVFADPAAFGLTNVTTPCLSATLAVCADPQQTLFWDTVHPTNAGHLLIAALAVTQVHP